MSEYLINSQKITAIADAIRETSGVNEGILIDDMPEKIRFAAFDKFWDVYQDNGARDNYGSAFSTYWNNDNFHPKYNIVPIYANYMFMRVKITDFDDMISRGLKLDFSNCPDCEGIFSRAEVVKLPPLDFSKALNLNYTFSSCTKLKTIEKMIINENTVFRDTFSACSSLERLNVLGTIGQNGFNVTWSKKLDLSSLRSIIAALKDHPNIESPLCTLGATNLAKLTSEDIENATQKGWTLA